ncbi:hypothetical protein PspLS_07453 [Pyricularia sp. CBS 133598]|nr:hypothetical protein PspLS_07453 [Pyricularia sp. CBS 133598]
MCNADYIYCCRPLPSNGKSPVHDTISSLINHSRFIQESKVLLPEQEQSFFCKSIQQSLPTAIHSPPDTSHHPFCVMPSHYSRSQCRCVVWTLYYTRCGHYVDASSSRDCTASTHSPTEMGCEERDGTRPQHNCSYDTAKLYPENTRAIMFIGLIDTLKHPLNDRPPMCAI